MTAAILFDTHMLIWSRLDPDELKSAERAAIVNASRRFISFVSLWEAAMLIGLRRILVTQEFFELPDGCEWLPIDVTHCRMLAALPRHTRDPFDRMLVAQAKSEGLALLTRDRALGRYTAEGVEIMRLVA